MKILRKIKALILTLLLLVIVIVVGVVFWIDNLAKAGLETGATFALGVDTTVDSVDVGILAGRTDLANLKVHNPEEFETEHFLALEKGALAVSLGSLRSDTVVIPEFTLSNIDMNLEKKGGKSNYGVIIENLEKLSAGDDADAKPTPAKQTDDGEGKKFVIREIVIQDVTVHVRLIPIGGALAQQTVPVKEIRLTDVGTGGNNAITVAELTGIIIEAILTAAIEQGGGLIPKDIAGELSASLASLGSLKDIGGSMATEAGAAIEKLGEGVGKSLGNLTGGDKNADTPDGETDNEPNAIDKAKEGLGNLLKPKEKQE